MKEVRDALVAAGITGPHRSHPRAKSIDQISGLLEGTDPVATFGLSGAERYSAQEILGFMADLTGCSPDIEDLQCEERIEPELTLEGLVAAGERLSEAAIQGRTLLVGTGHPTGMLEFYMNVADAFVRAGGKLLRSREEERLVLKKGRDSEIRYVGGVGCLAEWGSLRHTHSAVPMEAMLQERPWPDLVMGDHGFAGAAVANGIPTIAIMDINDHALAVAKAEGRDLLIVPLDDNRPPRLYEPAWRLIERILSV